MVRKENTREVVMKRLILVLGVAVAVLGSGVAAATMLSAGPSPSPSPDKKHAGKPAENDPDELGIHGGSISRFHTTTECKLVDISTLPGNWTHGDYVAAVAAQADASLVPIAARSDCGKPSVAAGHRHGPPDFVDEKIEAHRPGGAGPAKSPGD
jgi:hypothetical protein